MILKTLFRKVAIHLKEVAKKARENRLLRRLGVPPLRSGKVLSPYDVDIRWMLRAIYGLMVINLCALVVGLIERQWIPTITAAIWIVNNWVWLGTMHTQQRTRDESRIHAAGILTSLERKLSED